MRTPIFLLFFILVSFMPVSTLFAQGGQADHWYFGINAGLDFTSGAPVAVTNGALSTLEGCAAISDANSNLLFYTDGITVYDNTHTAMPNGNGLLGNSSSTQSGVIVPRPGSSTEFYVFTVDDLAGPNGFRYSLVDMTLNGGLGDVVTTEKNVAIHTPVCEKITAVRHNNGTDFWVIVHEWNSDAFLAYHVTSAGVNMLPITSNVGLINNGASVGAIGYLKASPNGTRLASAMSHQLNLAEVYDFDASTGVVSNAIQLNGPYGTFGPYGIEFSPNGQYVFVATFANVIHQFDLLAGTPTDIDNSDTIIASGIGQTETGALQLGPDNKIYVARTNNPHLAVIDQPNIYGVNSNFIDSAVFLDGQTSFYGLPTFITSFFNASFNFENICVGDSTFFFPDTTNIDSVKWNFDDPNSGVNNTSTDLFPFHIFTDTGMFNVRLIAHSDTLVDTSFKVIQILPIPTLDLGNDTALCDGDTLLKFATFQGASYLWNDSSISDSIIIDSSGTYSVTLTHVCGTLTDSIEVEYDFPLSFDLGPDTLLCASAGYVIDPQLPTGHNATYLWHDNSTDATFTATQTDTVTLTATNGCGPVSDTIVVTALPLPNSQLPSDTIACFDVPFTLNHDNIDSVTYFWSDSSSAPTFTVDSSGTYWLAATNNCGTTIDSFTVVYQDPIQLELGPDTSICQDDTITLNAAFPGATYEWYDGSTDSIHLATETGTYAVEVSVGPCSINDNVNITIDLFSCFDSIDCIVVVPNVFTPNGDGKNDLLLVTTTCLFGDFTLSIFNRWGQKVYEAEHENIGWDGTVNGIPAQEGVYYWIIDFKDEVVVDVDRQGKTGSVSIIR